MGGGALILLLASAPYSTNYLLSMCPTQVNASLLPLPPGVIPRTSSGNVPCTSWTNNEAIDGAFGALVASTPVAFAVAPAEAAVPQYLLTATSFSNSSPLVQSNASPIHAGGGLAWSPPSDPDLLLSGRQLYTKGTTTQNQPTEASMAERHYRLLSQSESLLPPPSPLQPNPPSPKSLSDAPSCLATQPGSRDSVVCNNFTSGGTYWIRPHPKCFSHKL